MKRLLVILAIFSIAHLAGVAGVLGYLAASGRITPQRIETIAAVLRGEHDPPDESTTTAPATQPADERFRQATAEAIRQQTEFEEIRRRSLERQVQEARQSLELVDRARLDVIQLREQLDQTKTTFEQQRDALSKQSDTAGFQRMLELLGTMSAKRAKDLLISGSEADAVRILSTMPKRRAGEILGACRTDEELAWAEKVLTRIGKAENPAAEPPANSERTDTP